MKGENGFFYGISESYMVKYNVEESFCDTVKDTV